jgi:hypothetical protein
MHRLKRFAESGSKAGIQPKHAPRLRRLLTALDVANFEDFGRRYVLPKLGWKECLIALHSPCRIAFSLTIQKLSELLHSQFIRFIVQADSNEVFEPFALLWNGQL